MTQLAHALPEPGLNHPPAPLRIEAVGRTEILALDPAQWDSLAASALVENPFYSRQNVLAALATVDKAKPLKAVLVRAADGELLGFFPYQPHSKVPFPLPVANALANDYLFSGTPLVHGDHAAAVVDSFLDAVEAGRAPRLWSFPDIDTGSPLAELLLDGALQRGLTTATVTPYSRAFLTRLPDGFEAHLQTVLSKNRLKDVRRTMRRLWETGTVELEHADTADRLPARLEQFLALEHSGWKGEAGTSFLSKPEDAAFARAAYVAGFAAIDSLLLDGKPIAMKLSIRTGRTAFTPKIAYDEAFKKLGPGMALEYLLLEAFYSSDRLEAVDAAATAEGHSALNFFNGEKAMATLLLGSSSWQVRLLAFAHRQREALKQRLKAMKAKPEPEKSAEKAD